MQVRSCITNFGPALGYCYHISNHCFQSFLHSLVDSGSWLPTIHNSLKELPHYPYVNLLGCFRPRVEDLLKRKKLIVEYQLQWVYSLTVILKGLKWLYVEKKYLRVVGIHQIDDRTVFNHCAERQFIIVKVSGKPNHLAH